MPAASATAPTRRLWAPQPGPQALLLSCPIEEILYGGARGGGKTEGVLGDWIRHERELGAHASGIIFRRRYRQLDRIRDRGKQLFGALGGRFYESAQRYEWVFPSGARLRLRALEKADDAEEYQGHEYTWIAFEELAQWPDPAPIDMLRACLRGAAPGQRRFLATANPGGPGHVWVRERFIEPAPALTPFDVLDDAGRVVRGEDGRAARRVYIPARVWDNPLLLEADPQYVARLRMLGPAWLVQAWLDGDWSVVAGGFLEGVWRSDRHVVPAFVPPVTWPRWRALDWGYARPYSIGWYTMDPATGVITRYRERYGWGGRANVGSREEAVEVAGAIRDAEAGERRAGCVIRRNPADPDIWGERGAGKSVATLFREHGVTWQRAKKGRGSRKAGAQVVIHYLEHRLFTVTDNCRHFLRTVPVIPSDNDNLEDVDDDAEDHAWDELRYSLTSRHRADRITPKPPQRAAGAKPPPLPRPDIYYARTG